MLRPDLERWALSEQTLTQMGLHASHPRTRERILALRDIARGCCASVLCKSLGRHVTTVLNWVHAFNQRGPQALIYQHSGGAPGQAKRLAPLIQEALDSAQQAAAGSKKRRCRR